MAIKVNDDVGHYFQTKKGLRQGDPLSPILFNIVVDMLAILIERAKNNGQIAGVVPHLVDDGLSILQYADDTILFMEHDLEKAANMKLILSAFEQLSGLKINFHKSELFCWPRMQLLSMPSYSDVSKVNFLLSIWLYQYTIEDWPMQNENTLKSVCRKGLLVGKENYYP